MLRGLAGKTRSEPFDLVKVFNCLSECKTDLATQGPINPRALIPCSTFFLLRELEASAVDISDVSFGDSFVTLTLPVSKVDWAAKGCRRTWKCICHLDRPCPFHVLLGHFRLLEALGFKHGPFFPDRHGS